MKKAHFLLWVGCGGLIAFAIGEFLRAAEIDSRLNYIVWSSLLMIGGAITAKQNKK